MIVAIGTTRNSRKTSANGATCRYVTQAETRFMTWRGRRSGGALSSSPMTSRRDELVPLLHHVAVLIHHRVPARDGAHAVVERAAVAHGAGLLDHLALRVLDVALGGLALHPEAPLVLGHVGLGRVE